MRLDRLDAIKERGPEGEAFPQAQETPADLSDADAADRMALDDLDSVEQTRAHLHREAQTRQEQEAEKLAGLKQDREQRKEFAGKIFWLVCSWLAGLIVLLLLSGLQCVSLSDQVLMALIGGASVNIIGLMVIVANYLFPKIK
jgi:uncharacterized membrane protein YdbT with pleckstrin-like domain